MYLVPGLAFCFIEIWNATISEEQKGSSLYDRLDFLNRTLSSMKAPVPHGCYNAVIRSHAYASDKVFRSQVDNYFSLKHEKDAILATLEILDKSTFISPNIRFQSEEVSAISTGAVGSGRDESRMTLTDVVGDAVKESDVGFSHFTEILTDNYAALSKFLERPVMIADGSLALSTNISLQWNPWTLYLAEPAIRAKLRNVGFLRATMNVQINISGMPFHYGRLVGAYWPFADVSDLWTSVSGNGQANMACALTQLPGRQLIDPKENKPAVFRIPWISPMPMGRLFNNSAVAIPAGTAFSDFDLGLLMLNSINQIKSTSSSPSTVSYMIYAWLTDVELGCPTGTVLTITTESDERERGPVEKWSSGAAKVAGALSTIPEIAPLALPSAMALKGISNLAAYFGWSVPNVEKQPMRVKNEPFQCDANTIGFDTGKRITLDPKQELTVDPRIVGVDCDELSFDYLSGVESYLDTFTWAHTVTPLSTVMYYVGINPCIGVQRSTNNYIQPTALAFCAMPFQFWRGDIILRFEIVCSSFHRGKYAVFFDPNIAHASLITSGLSLNKQYMKVIDIQETQSVEFCVSWSYVREWCRNFSARSNIAGTCGTTNPFSASTATWDMYNGFVGIIPFTALQSPDNSDVSVNIYIRGKDMHYNFTTDTLLPSSRALTQSVEVDRPSEVQRAVTCFELNPTGAKSREISTRYFGEEVHSFRSLLKRFQTTFNGTAASTATSGYVSISGSIMPVINPTFSVDTTLVATFLGYLRYAYLGWRGGLRKRIRFVSPSMEGMMNNVKVSLTSAATSATTTAAGYTAVTSNVFSLVSGTCAYVPCTNGGIEFEVPYYSNNLFINSPDGTNLGTPSATTTWEQNFVRSYTVRWETMLNSTTFNVYEETAAAEDFTFLRFICAPPYKV